MIGGGDTPSTKTLWILRGEGLNVFGQFQDGILFYEGPSEDKWYVANQQGKIVRFVDYNPEQVPQLKEQFAQYFGEIKSIQILATGHEIGYVVPNWAEYKVLN